MNYTIRPAPPTDLDSMMRMVAHSRKEMRKQGNLTQWTGYPLRSDLAADVAAGVAYIIEEQGHAVGTFALVPGAEPTYGRIDHGRWIDPQAPYATLHRLAAMPGTHGIARAALDFAQSRFPYLRADTHADNRAMRHILQRAGFVYSGIVYMADGAPRRAGEWWRHDEVHPGLKAYVEASVLPRYAAFDAAHREEHARRVVARSMVMARHREVNPSALYAAAAMHDLGLAFGRESHHLHSGCIVRADHALRQWFSAEEVEQIAQAVEDHRASASRPPRSLMGALVAEADRDVEPTTIVRRTVEYGLGHYPALDREGHWQRMLAHLEEKYSPRGYIKLWLVDSPNAEPLAELHSLMADQQRLRALFEEAIEDALGSGSSLQNKIRND